MHFTGASKNNGLERLQVSYYADVYFVFFPAYPTYGVFTLLSSLFFTKVLQLQFMSFFSHVYEVNTDPWIACPMDRVEELDPDEKEVVLGFKWQVPRTNMKNVAVSPSYYNERYPFPVGRHLVMWMGVDSGREMMTSCSFHIDIIGE